MGAFIGYKHRGVWVSNAERNAFLDWYAEHRCRTGDARWEFCNDEGNRWNGCCLELADIISDGELLTITDAECDKAAKEFWPEFPKLLFTISQITSGHWQHDVSSSEALRWRDVVH